MSFKKKGLIIPVWNSSMVSVVIAFVIVLLLYLLATLAKFSLPLFFFLV